MKRRAYLMALLIGLVSPCASAEQFFEIGDLEAHYMILDTLSLEAEVAENYGIERARNVSLITLSVLDETGAPVQAEVAGRAINLLGNRRELDFRTVEEGDANYAVATLQHSEETMRFEITVRTPDGRTHAIKFQQKLYLGIE